MHARRNSTTFISTTHRFNTVTIILEQLTTEQYMTHKSMEDAVHS